MSLTVRHDYPLIPESILIVRFVREDCLIDFDSADVPEIVFPRPEKDLESLAIPDVPMVAFVTWEPNVVFTQVGVHRRNPFPEIATDPSADFFPVDFNDPAEEIEAVEKVALIPDAIRPPFPEIVTRRLPPFVPSEESDPSPEMITKSEDDFFP
jgi:hypothetical protein